MSKFNSGYSAQLACMNGKIPHVPLQLHVPCPNPKPSCPQPPSGPGTGHIMNVPWTNIQVHKS